MKSELVKESLNEFVDPSGKYLNSENNLNILSDEIVKYLNDAYLQFQPSCPVIKKQRNGGYRDCDGGEIIPIEILQWFVEMVNEGDLDFEEIAEEGHVPPELGPKLFDRAKDLLDNSSNL